MYFKSDHLTGNDTDFDDPILRVFRRLALTLTDLYNFEMH